MSADRSARHPGAGRDPRQPSQECPLRVHVRFLISSSHLQNSDGVREFRLRGIKSRRPRPVRPKCLSDRSPDQSGPDMPRHGTPSNTWDRRCWPICQSAATSAPNATPKAKRQAGPATRRVQSGAGCVKDGKPGGAPKTADNETRPGKTAVESESINTTARKSGVLPAARHCYHFA